ncbi:putative permease of the major facilitator superfamily [Thiomonas arsenitoxydans]|uniref:Permease of the major facilitator superfamily n=1 Tax=Thiomonas arsenitoxydans (strain DSM 22701 / CIP 110005 / 3As) TaxID=426114 RepID=D6CSN9_THIA3|nr:DmsC/YnfH family molybdoenzyme membrane anchor subunit [Thiomonas arsenitoxydans]CAZ88308.1 putative permease of the major facilitator superfamily [Thiomonas arsenitoxydans]CQR33130.1 putative permease of the major facilitator superfamily [Thiomonas arsenitoxydans]CQR33371.1 putative permease of the major facilitator superfamily [Thiomonas arsenitoxydans]CQR33580.1 putative permease of the major facilitator superfamily [Thiomonas arsenitoxydans]CQR40005.1 putative permease of the major faci
MRPAFSVLLLTTLVGCAQGLGVVVALPALFGAAQSASWLAFCSLSLWIILGLGVIGLAASFGHLGRPERAWRAAAMWRTSWLSREVIALPAFLGLTALSLLGIQTLHDWPGLLAAVLIIGALALWVCTAMIYAGVRFLREWATPLTALNFVLMGLASGCLLASVLALWRLAPQAAIYAHAAAVLLGIALVGRLAALLRVRGLTPAGSMQSAIGVGSAVIRQTSKGFTAGAFNTREFFHGRSALWVAGARWGFVAFGFVLPISLLLLTPQPLRLVGWPLALASNLLGMLAERWDFFAQVRHPQNRYYQAAL